MLDVKINATGEAFVTFTVPATCGARKAAVVGEFNDWSTTADPMTRGVTEFCVTIPIPTGRTYRFRYLLDDERWENDWAAHAYVPNEHGGDDSELDLRDADQPSDGHVGGGSGVTATRHARRGLPLLKHRRSP